MKQNHRKQSGSRLGELFHAYLLNHAHGLFSSLGRLSRTPFTSAMTILVLAIAISLASSFYIVVANIQQLTGNLESSNQMSLFLHDNISDAAGQKLAEQIQQNGSVMEVKFISKKQALEEFKANSGFSDALNALERNPLPSVIQVVPKNALENNEDIEKLMADFKQFPQVDFVQVDMQWVARLQTIMLIASRGVMLVSLLLGFAVTFITGNTIRLELQNRQDEVFISKLVGATHAFIQRPFLYTGFWLGFISGFLGWLIMTIMLLILETPVEKLSTLYNSSFDLLFLSFSEFILLLMISSVLAVLGSWAVLHYQLRQLKPQ
ncbi:Cell-division-associated, ABC-transporter-like signaling protein FtsX [Methylomonas albis]|uniref:Cell division protein FtsX n=1 Tax=Methylomonas albis TaxID=1854563 RepID=A0ABR9D1E2_9GAMM|nr:permease-like cell division protein FtsX [Methylomonas albis]MBD9356923.1 ABC transporter permease [Methylomonas albis]CAD6880111.1 Cell-division-associated, ABC-transporter-like signaling protein FtsX [Methylomonas albis]